MSGFAIVKILTIFKIIENLFYLNYYDIFCLLFFAAFFFPLLKTFIFIKTKVKEDKLNNQLKAIEESNLVAYFDPFGKILSCNKKFCKTTGYFKKDLISSHHSKLCESNYYHSSEYTEFWKKLREGNFVSGKFKRVGKNGNLIHLFGTYTPLLNSDGKVYKILKIATDITSQHNAEAIAKKKTVYLEHAAKILRHDIHSGINTYIPRGIKSLKRRITQEQIDALKIDMPLKMMESGLEHTQKVYKGVYEFTNLVKENSEMTKNSYDLKIILKEFLKNTAYFQQVLIDELGTCKVNESLFCTAIDNLIRNGLKYNDSESKWVKIYRKNNSLFIQDNGRGMSQKQFLQYSKPYVRGINKEVGTGLGLNICVAILYEHKFNIFATKRKGTKIEIKLNNDR